MGLGLIKLALAFSKSTAIGIGETVDAVETLHTTDVALELALLGSQWQPTGMTETVNALLKTMIQGNPLIEDKTLPMPTATGFRYLLEILEDASA